MSLVIDCLPFLCCFVVLAIELLAACQAVEFLRPLKTTEPLEEIYSLVRSVAKYVLVSLSPQHNEIIVFITVSLSWNRPVSFLESIVWVGWCSNQFFYIMSKLNQFQIKKMMINDVFVLVCLWYTNSSGWIAHVVSLFCTSLYVVVIIFQAVE